MRAITSSMVLICLAACKSPSHAAAGITVIDAADTAAYSAAGPEAVAAVANCRAPKCRPDIFRGPGSDELTVGLDSGRGAEFQWHAMPTSPPPAGQGFQDSSWNAMLAHWESSTPAPLLIIDGVPRTYAYAREHVSLSSVWGMQQLSPAEAKKLSSDSGAAHDAIVITTKAHAPKAPR